MASFEVRQTDDVPAGMDVWEVPKQMYAIFPCKLPTLGDAYQFAFDTWLPASGYKKAAGPDFELYPAEFECFRAQMA